MLSKRTHPMIGKLSELLISVNRAAFPDTSTSPRGPLDFKILNYSPRSNSKRCNYDLGGVGLGILAALEKSRDCSLGKQEIIGKYSVSGSDQNRSGSDPIPVANNRGNKDERLMRGGGFDDMETESLEDYTYITCHRGPNKSYTRVYKDGGERFRHENQRFRFAKTCDAAEESLERSMEVFPEYPCLELLSSCHACKKKLHGKDIYMYRGEKGFCSVECRSNHIMKDERKEKCRSEVSTSPYTAGQIFSTGVLVI